jgi:hypothetical protein
MSIPARRRAQAIALRRGGRHTLAVPLAPRLAARIAERPYPAFLTDPTQLTNGLNDLLEAVRPDGTAVTVADHVTDPAHREAALEATRRLRATVRDDAVLIAVLPGLPDLVETVKAFLEAGVDGIVLTGGIDAGQARTIGNVTRFHRAMAHVAGAGASGLPGAELVPLDAPAPKEGLVLTECGPEAQIPQVQDWLAAVRGG